MICSACNKPIEEITVKTVSYHTYCKSEESIPISKIKARIKELEDSPAPQWVGHWDILDAKLEELKDLLSLPRENKEDKQ